MKNLTQDEKTALKQIFAEAMGSKNLLIAANIIHFLNKMNEANDGDTKPPLPRPPKD